MVGGANHSNIGEMLLAWTEPGQVKKGKKGWHVPILTLGPLRIFVFFIVAPQGILSGSALGCLLFPSQLESNNLTKYHSERERESTMKTRCWLF